MRQHRLNAVEGSGQVDADHPVPVLGAHLADHPSYGRARAVDENVDAAPGLGYARGQSPKGLTIGDIERMCCGMAVPASNLDRDPLGRRRVAIENRHLRAGGGEGAAGRCADAVAPAGDDGDFPEKSSVIASTPLLQLVEQRLCRFEVLCLP